MQIVAGKELYEQLLRDIKGLSEVNRALAARELDMGSQALENDLPTHEHLLRLRDYLLRHIKKMADIATMKIEKDTIKQLNPAVDQIDSAINTIEYPGLFLIWQYAQDLTDSVSQRLLKGIRLAKNYADKKRSKRMIAKIFDANIDKILKKNRDRTVVIQVEATDFLDLVLDEKLSGCMLSLGAAAAFCSRMIGLKDAVSSFWTHPLL